MSIYEDLVNLLEPFRLPVAPQVYTGTAAAYIVIDAQITSSLAGDDAPVFGYEQATLSLYTPTRMDTVQLCADLQHVIYDAGFTFPVLSPGGTSMDGARKCQVLTFGRWAEWPHSS